MYKDFTEPNDPELDRAPSGSTHEDALLPHTGTLKFIPAHAADLPQFENHDEQDVKYTTCYMCACRCGIKVTLENQKIRFIEGNPDHPVNKGVLCAKGSAGIMKQYSRARLRNPLRRKPDSDRGTGEFEEITWEEALTELTQRLESIRQDDPKKLAYFTGRDQMQALSGLWATQFGTINWAAHGGFCSVNMAAAGLYTTGHSFWEFGDADFERTKYFVLWGVAEDHSSNPLKLGIDQLKRRGAKFVSINPVRTGYSAVADEWVPIRPGTDGLLALSMIHVLLKRELFDWEYLVRYTNSPYLVVQTPGKPGDGLFLRGDDGQPLVWDLEAQEFVDGTQAQICPALLGDFTAPDGRKLKTSMTLAVERYLDDEYSPERVAQVCGLEADHIERLALEMAHIAFEESIEIPCRWTDWAGREHDSYIGRPVSMHAMRGVSAHSNGFHTCRAIHLLQLLLGTVDVPGGHRAKGPYPKHIPPKVRPAQTTTPGEPLASPPLGFPSCPEDLVLDPDGGPARIDKAYSWEAPLAAHGMMHMVITNAYNGDPYPIDTLMLFMANMSWNSSMNTSNVMEMLRARDGSGNHKIPYIVVSDAFRSEMVDYADLVLPDTTYLERYDAMSLLDRPISEADAICDSIRAPVVAPDRNVRPWQDVMVEIAGRLGLPAFTNEDGTPKYEDYKDFVVRFEKTPGIGFLAGWRGENGEKVLRGEPNPNQWERYIQNTGFFRHELPESARFYKFANKDYLEIAKNAGFIGTTDPIVMAVYSEELQKFRLAGQGLYEGPQPTAPEDCERLATYFDPLPFWYWPLEQSRTSEEEYPFYAVTQRPMVQYHSWDSQNAWLRQIMSHNKIYLNRKRGEAMGVSDDDWVWLSSHNGRVRAQVKLTETAQTDTAWTWNAVGKRSGTWGLERGAPEASKGFLMNHLIAELLPPKDGERRLTNSDPVTGQAAWYDLRIRIERDDTARSGSQPQFAESKPLPGDDSSPAPSVLRHHTHKPVNLRRRIVDTLLRR